MHTPEGGAANSDERAARYLWDHWRRGDVISALPNDLIPASLEQAHRIQALLPRVSGRPVLGWKLAATNAEGQAHIGVDGPIPGRPQRVEPGQRITGQFGALGEVNATIG